MEPWISAILLCPDCHAAGLARKEKVVSCASCGEEFPFFREKPVFIRHDNDVFPIKDYEEKDPEAGAARAAAGWKERLYRLLPSNSTNLAREGMKDKLQAAIRGDVLVVGSGGQAEEIKSLLCARTRLACCDVDPGAVVDCYADAHDLPFRAGAFDAVIITAVLEHVALPRDVVREIHRVLKLGGVVYSEVPFMQQVHGGAYDFTRFSMSGHRVLFRDFAEIDSGLAGGPGSALCWAIQYFFLSVFNGKPNAFFPIAVSRLLFFWLRYFDYAVKKSPFALDGASGTYFFGRKTEKPDSLGSIIRKYSGGIRTSLD